MGRASSDIVKFVTKGLDFVSGGGPSLMPVVGRNFVFLSCDLVFAIAGTMSNGGSISLKTGGVTLASGALPLTGNCLRLSITPAVYLLNQVPGEGGPGTYINIDTPPSGTGLSVVGACFITGYWA